MPFQPPRYEYPLQTVMPDYGNQAAQGIQRGIVMGGQISQGIAQYYQTKKLANQDQLTQDIGKAHDKTQAEIAALEKPAEPALTNVQTPNQDETIKKMMVADQTAQNNAVPGLATYNNSQAQTTGASQIASDPRLGVAPQQQADVPLANVQTEKAIADNEAARMKYDKDMADYQGKVIELRSKMANNIIDLHYKHGFPEEAQKMESKYIEQAANVAKFIDPTLAEKVWNNGPLAGKLGKATIQEDNKWIKLNDTTAINQKTGETMEVPMTAADFIKRQHNIPEGAESFIPIFDSNNKVIGIKLHKNPKDNTRELKKDERESKKEERENKRILIKDNNDYYSTLEKEAHEYIKEHKRREPPESPKAWTEEETNALKYEKILGKLQDYRSMDLTSINAGKDPIKRAEISSFLNATEGQPAQNTSKAPTSRKEYFAAMKKANPKATDAEINDYLDKKGVK